MSVDLRLPTGFRARQATPDDVAAIADLIASCELANDGMAEVDASDVINDLERVADPRDAIVVTDGTRTVAWATLHGERATIDVHPDVRSRGIGAALLAWSEAHARAAGRTGIRQTVTDNDHAAAALFADHGYAPSHTAWILEIALDDEPSTVVAPDGIAIRPYRRDDARAVHRVIDDAFSEWPGREPQRFEEWAPYVLAHPAFSPELSRLAYDGGELVGVALALDYPDVVDGWIQQVATKASHRNRGIARALLASAFAGFHARGRRMVGLSTDSRTGALTLYERLGMRVRRSYTGWVKDLS